MSDITQDVILYMAFMMMIVFVVAGSTLVLDNSIGDPKVTEFNDNGLDEPLLFDKEDKWEIVSHENDKILVKGTVYRSGEVNLSQQSIERTDSEVVLEVGVDTEQVFESVNIRTSETDEPVNNAVIPLYGGGYEFNSTVSNVGTEEDFTVKYVETEDKD